ncbi:MAG: GDP-mannose 4,6-dehydratase [Pirellulales bacterium]
MARRALIIGISGQDGGYLTELLAREGYRVHATLRPDAEPPERLAPLHEHITYHSADLSDPSSPEDLIRRIEPQEIYNLAAQSSVAASWDQPLETAELTGMAVARWLEALRRFAPKARFFQAGSSEIFAPGQGRCDEWAAIGPRNPYGAAKAYAHHLVGAYRSQHGLFIASGILFNHESPWRDMRFVTRKITDGVARIKLGMANSITLGNLDARRDWGFAGDYVVAMWQSLQQDTPDDYVIATGELHGVGELVEAAFAHVGLEAGPFIRMDPKLMRAAGEQGLAGSAAKARQQLGWEPRTGFRDWVAMMVEADLERVAAEIGSPPPAR